MPTTTNHLENPWSYYTIYGTDPVPAAGALAWAAGSPSSAVGNGYGVARLRRTSGRLDFEFGLWFGSTTSAGTSTWNFTPQSAGGLTPTFPSIDSMSPMVGAVSAAGIVGGGIEPGPPIPALAVHAGAYYPGVAIWSIAVIGGAASLNTLTFAFGSTTSLASPTVPFTWASGDLLLASGFVSAVPS